MYHTTPPSNDLKTTLSAALGVLAVVDKQREIYFIEHTKFHLDTVANLGTFVEIEVIDKGAKQAIETLVQQCNDYVHLLGLLADDMIAVSYSDLILNNLIKI
jgi:predicted adenylyl cyclase CyaB